MVFVTQVAHGEENFELLPKLADVDSVETLTVINEFITSW